MAFMIHQIRGLMEVSIISLRRAYGAVPFLTVYPAAAALLIAPVLGTQLAVSAPSLGLLNNTSALASLSVGTDHVCAIEQSGSAVCWGHDRSGESTPPTGQFMSISAGGAWEDSSAKYPTFRYVSCGIQRTGGGVGPLVCWGWHNRPPRGLFRQVSVGDDGACALTAPGRMACWRGPGTDFRVKTPRGRFAQVSVGAGYSCGVRVGGSPYCWGKLSGPIDRAQSNRFLTISVGSSSAHDQYTVFACGLTASDTAACWGDNSAINRNTPSGTFRSVDAVSGFYGFACGLRRSGAILCWGQYRPKFPGHDYMQVDGGSEAVCAIRIDGTALCRGYDQFGQLEAPGAPYAGIAGTSMDGYCAIREDASKTCWDEYWAGFPGHANPPGSYRQVAVGLQFNCALSTELKIYCTRDGPSPPHGPGTPPYSDISAAGTTVCAVRADAGSIVCWGYVLDPPDPPTEGVFTQVAVGSGYRGDFACALRLGGSAVCFGNARGRDGKVDGQLLPPPLTFTQLSLGYGDACGLTTDGTAACWGKVNAKLPSGRYLQVAAGQNGDVCGIQDDHQLVCTGEAKIPPWHAYRFDQVTVQGPHTLCGIEVSGSIRCWGLLEQGDLRAVLPAAGRQA